MKNKLHKCRYCEFNGSAAEWDKQSFPFWHITLFDSLFAKGKLEREYICPKCGHTKYIAEDPTNFKIAASLFILLALLIVSAMLYFKLTE